MANKKAKQGELRESAHKIWLAGLGALAVAEQEGNKLFTSLVDKGRTFDLPLGKPVGSAARKVRSGVNEVTSRAGRTLRRVEEAFDDQVSSALKRIGVPTRREIADLTRKVDTLTKKLAAKNSRTRVTKKKTTRKAKKKKAAR